jgi:ABC-type polysaccharide/polyol phosphate export permease
LNPAHGLIANFRASALGVSFDWYALCVSASTSVLLLVISAVYFKKVERSFADII